MNFEKAVELVPSIIDKCTDKVKLQLYGLYKQSTVGPCNIPRPGIFSPKEGAKWDAWDSRKDLTKEEAKKKYVNTVSQLIISFS